MLQRRYRLRKNSEFVATYAQKKYVSNSFMSLNIGKQKPFSDYISKVAFVVSKKIDKRAVVRNRIKRRMREAYKILYKQNPNINKWMSIIFTAKIECIEADFNIILEQMKYLIQKAGQKYD